MKQHKYQTVFHNGKTQEFVCQGFVEAIVLSMAYAQKKGWYMGIKEITDETGVRIHNIKPPTYEVNHG